MSLSSIGRVKGLLAMLDSMQKLDRKMVKAGTITYEEAGRQAAKLSKDTGKEIYKCMRDLYPEGKLTEGEALEIIPPALRSNYEYVIKLAEQAQTEVNKKAGVGLNPITPEFDEERANGLAKYVSEKEDFTKSEDEFVLQVEENGRHIIDDSIMVNAEAHERAGLEVTVIRRYDGVGLHDGADTCEFCERLDGDWSLADAKSEGVFSRHPGCGCDILYESQRYGWQRQGRDQTWRNIEPQEVLERRRTYGL